MIQSSITAKSARQRSGIGCDAEEDQAATPSTASEVQSFQDRRAPRRLAMTAVTPTLPATID